MNRHQRRAAAKQGNAQGGSSGQQSHVAELIAEGVRRHQAGQLPEAEKNYRLALERQPDQPDGSVPTAAWWKLPAHLKDAVLRRAFSVRT